MDVSLEELRGLIDSKAHFQLIDVREPFEFEEGAIPGARNIPLGELRQSALENTLERKGIQKGVPLILYCRSGNRSSYAAALLSKLGFDARNFRGSWLEWSRRA